MVLLMSVISLVTLGQNKGVELLNVCIKKIESEKHITYHASYREKSVLVSDTVKRNGLVKLRRDEQDTRFGGYVWVTSVDSGFAFYDLYYTYFVHPKQKEAIIFVPGVLQEWAIHGSQSRDLIWRDFLAPENWKRIIEKGTEIILLGDTVVKNKESWNIQIRFPDNNLATNRIKNIYINKKDSVPFLISNIDLYKQTTPEFSEFFIDSYSFEPLPPDAFEISQIPDDYSIEEYHKRDLKLLDTLTTAPGFSGKAYKNKMAPDSTNFIGNVTILDFWYRACFPCMKGIAMLDSIGEKYPNNLIQIISVNAYDNNEKGISKLPKFLEYNPIHNPIFLVDDEVPKAYHVYAWPTFYIINKEGKIVYSHIGWNEDLFNDLSKVIDKLLIK